MTNISDELDRTVLKAATVLDVLAHAINRLLESDDQDMGRDDAVIHGVYKGGYELAMEVRDQLLTALDEFHKNALTR